VTLSSSQSLAVTAGGRSVVLVLGIATFLVAAKTHGRQLRLERELAGYFHVSFGAQNPAFVEALWRRERILYWSLAAVLALAAIIFRVLAPRLAWPLPLEAPGGERSWIGVGFLHVLVPLVGSFLVTGLLSVGRFVLSARGGIAANPERPAHWLSTATWGTAGWWALTLAMGVALCFFAWRRPA
jgi:hypothetical protein